MEWTNAKEHLLYLVNADGVEEHADVLLTFNEITIRLDAENLEFFSDGELETEEDSEALRSQMSGIKIVEGTLNNEFSNGFEIHNVNGSKIMHVFEEGTGCITYYRDAK